MNSNQTLPGCLRTSFNCLAATIITASCQFGSLLAATTEPLNWTTQQDHTNMMEQLGIIRLRPGPSGQPGATNSANYDPAKANPFPTLPDILTLKNGQKVTTADMWWKERRPEIVEGFEREVVGRVPKDVPKVRWSITTQALDRVVGKISVNARQLVGHVDNSACPGIEVNIQMTLVTPKDAKVPVPVLMMFGGFGGGGFPRRAGESAPTPRFGFGAANFADPPPTEQLLAAGWGYATINPNSIQADNGAGLTKGIIGLVNKGQPRKPDDWGALRAWAWGAARGLDYLETDPTVDAKKVGIEGVSRYGKAALITMAFEPRFAMVLVGSSGEGGAKLHRRNFGEAVESLTGSGEYHWMAGNFLKYGTAESSFGSKNAGDLPVDAHELIALCAPRPTFISYGIPEKGDANWLDQQGSFMATVAAGPVFRLLGARDLGVTEDYHTAPMPPVNTGLLDGELAWRQHNGGHEDWSNMKYFIAWANRLIGHTPPVAAADPAKMPLPLKVVGTQILNSDNKPVILRGVNAASLEWTSDGQGHILQSVNTAIQEWHANIIRLPLAQDRWFGKAPEQKDEGVAYRALVKAIVDTCATQACYIALDLHWSDCGEWGTNIAQHSMPDQNSVVFWKDCAAAYQNHPAVIFDLYNEPHNVTWDIWLKGGTITDRPNGRRGGPPRTYEAVGMQTLLDTVRATGAKNLVIAGGLDWAYDFSGILDGRQLSDPGGNGVLYANHAYNNKGHSVETWISRMEQAAAKLPVIVAEYGGSGGPNRRAGRFGAPGRASSPGGDDWLLHVMQALQEHNWSWIAWDFHPAAGPTLISGWDYTPTPDFGVFVKQALAGTLPKYTPPITSGSPSPATNSSAPVTAPLSSAALSPGNEVSGTWKAEFDTQIGKQKYVYEFNVDGGKLTGRAIGDIAGTRSETEIGQGKLSGAEIYFVETVNYRGQEIPVTYRGRITGDEIKFTRTVADSITEEVVAKKVKDAAAK